MRISRALFVGVAVAALLAPPVFADSRHHDARPEQKPASATMPMMSGLMDQGGMMMPVIGRADHIEGRLAFLKTELKITDAQLAQWNTFADVVRSSASQMSDMMKQMPGMQTGDFKPSLPEKIAMHEKRMTAHLEMLGRIKAALLPLYTTFSDEQKAAANSLLCPMRM